MGADKRSKEIFPLSESIEDIRRNQISISPRTMNVLLTCKESKFSNPLYH